METLNLLQNCWFILIGLLFLVYSILDGFDLGVGALLPLMAKNKSEQSALLSSIAPFWDGNEVWLLTGGGALFASFPHAYATVFSGFYLALMLVLFALIFRAVSFEFIYHADQERTLWKWAFVAGSFIPALLFGVALGNVVLGVPLDENMNFTGNFFTLLRPFPLVMGLLGLNAILLQGTTFAAWKTGGEIRARARKLSGILWISFILLLGLSLLLGWIYTPGNFDKILAWIFLAWVLAAWGMLRKSLKLGRDRLSFFMSSLSFAGLWGIVGAIHFPRLVTASNDIALSLTIRNASSTGLTLKVMLIIALIGLPLVLLYTFIIFRVFRKKTNP